MLLSTVLEFVIKYSISNVNCLNTIIIYAWNLLWLGFWSCTPFHITLIFNSCRYTHVSGWLNINYLPQLRLTLTHVNRFRKITSPKKIILKTSNNFLTFWIPFPPSLELRLQNETSNRFLASSYLNK